MHIKKYLLFCLLIFLISNTIANSDLEDFIRQSHEDARRLNEAVSWVIEEGIAINHTQGATAFNQQLEDKYKATMFEEYSDEENDIALASFIFSAPETTVAHGLMIMHREKIGGQYYEYWYDGSASQESNIIQPSHQFYISKSDSLTGPRHIVTSSTTFIESYPIGEVTFSFPTDNQDKVQFLQPWLYPDTYRGTALESVVESLE